MAEPSSIQLWLSLQNGLTAIIVVYVAIQQWKLAENKLRLDLFEKRYKVFDATRKFLVIILQEATFQNADLFEFYAGTADAAFLFKDKDGITSLLDSIRDHALKMRALGRQYSNLPVGNERTQLIEGESTELKWLTEELRNLGTKFHSYLGFTQ
jgi:hypothetical protein